MNLKGRFFALAVGMLGVSGLALCQPAQTAKQAGKPIKIGPGDQTVDETPEDVFVLMGNLTVGNKVPEADPSTVNFAQLDRSLKDIKQLNAPLKVIVTIGGLVANEVGDSGAMLKSRLKGLQDHIKPLVTVPFYGTLGSEALGADAKFDQSAVDTWKQFTSDAGWSTKFPSGTSANYTKDQGATRLVFVDTMRPDGIDVAWLEAEIQRAEKEKGVDRVCVFGSRPIVKPLQTPLGPTLSSFVESEAAGKARVLLANCPKVVAYFCGKPATFEQTLLVREKMVRQIIIGNGGGPLDPNWIESGKANFGFALLVISSSGSVSLVPFERTPPAPPQNFFSDSPVPLKSALARTSIVLWRKPRVPRKK